MSKMQARSQMSKTTRIIILENGKKMAYNFFPHSISCHEKGLRCLYQSEKKSLLIYKYNGYFYFSSSTSVSQFFYSRATDLSCMTWRKLCSARSWCFTSVFWWFIYTKSSLIKKAAFTGVVWNAAPSILTAQQVEMWTKYK